MNKYQQAYIEKVYAGKTPRSKGGKEAVEVLGKMKSDKIRVHFPDFTGFGGKFTPAHVTEYTVCGENNLPEGKMNISGLAANLALWESRGYKIEYL